MLERASCQISKCVEEVDQARRARADRGTSGACQVEARGLEPLTASTCAVELSPRPLVADAAWAACRSKAAPSTSSQAIGAP